MAPTPFLRYTSLVPSAAPTLLVLALMATATPPASYDPFRAEWTRWHEERVARLREPTGWLALAGLHWLEPGPNRVPGLPGTFTLAGGQVSLAAAAGDGWRDAAGAAVTSRALRSDAGGATPDRLTLGSRTVAVIDRGGKLAVRVWDAERPERKAFAGIPAFPPDPRWRIEARWESYPAPRVVEVPSVVGIPTEARAPGRAHFTVGGRAVSLEPTQDGEDLFFVFKDATAPRETYGAGRFLVAEAPRVGKVILDFNRAYNPPCVFTPHATCPLPLPENVLPVRIEAGEKLPSDH